jgi:gamma-glutamyltranspeptidase
MANSIAPRKRPLNNACPMLLRQPDRDVGIGLPGGRRIVCVAPRMAQCIVEFGATSLEAASAPRMHVEMAEPLQIEETVPQKIITGLRAMGHEVNTVKGIAGGAHNAEFLKKESRARAGGNTWAAGAD